MDIQKLIGRENRMKCVNCGGLFVCVMNEFREFIVNGERVMIDDRFHRCEQCGEEWSQEGFDVGAEILKVREIQAKLYEEREEAIRKIIMECLEREPHFTKKVIYELEPKWRAR
jgi:hypothetical protein